ncbi:hypothetical protein [uncultured Cohaesibacter sp.]|uniref:hypothetical protein n=1 Tax=uncultured Cohaesibacter sp. TaxID=1002546 RepID=UPI0029C6F5D3|nr:hypothetical protein [uncultured Cohaesibacter sp.]
MPKQFDLEGANSATMDPPAVSDDTNLTADPSDATLPDESPAASQSSSETTDTDTLPPEPRSMAEAVDMALEQAAELSTSDKTEEERGDQDATTEDAGTEGDKASDEPVKDGSDEDEHPDPTAEELASYKPNIRKRIERLLDQRRTIRTELENIRPQAENYGKIQSFMQDNNLLDQEVAELFLLGADLKSGNVERLSRFIDRVMPVVQTALEATGRAVPRDLTERVDNGEMTEDAAKLFGRERQARVALEAQRDADVRRQQTDQENRNRQNVWNAVTTWQDQARQTDPDFDRKADALLRVSQAMVAQKGAPRTPDEAVQYAKQAYEEVNRMVQSLRPAPKPTGQRPRSGGAAPAGGASREPSSLKDAILMGLSAAR